MADLSGRQLGNYHLLRQLGSGGFAEVYLGEHIYLGTTAAVKILQARLVSHEDRDAFSYEGHKDTVTTVAWSGDGKYIASAGLDTTVQIWKPA